MNKTELKRVIDLMTAAKGKTDKIILTPISTGVCFSVISQTFMTHMIINGDSIDERSIIMLDQLDMIKAVHKGMKSNEDMGPDELIELFGPMDHRLTAIESNTFTPVQEFKNHFDFEVDFNVLNKAYAALKEKSGVMRIQVDVDKRHALLSNTSGDVSLIGLFIS